MNVFHLFMIMNDMMNQHTSSGVLYLVGVGKATHARHDAEHVVVARVDANLGGVGGFNGGVREHELEGRVINAGHVAGARRLVLFRAEGERVHVDAGVRSAGVVLPRLNLVKVGALTLREAVLAVELKLGGDDRVLAPAVHVKRGLGEHEGASIRHSRLFVAASTDRNILFENITVNESSRSENRIRRAERLDGVREGVKSIGVVERLSTKGSEEGLARL